MAKQQSCSISLSVYVELKLFLYVKLNLLLFKSNSNCSSIRQTQLFLLWQTQLVLIYVKTTFFLYVELNCSCYFEFNSVSKSAQLCSKTAQLLQRVLLFLLTYFVKSPVSGHFINAYSVKSSVILYSALCSRTSLYPVSRVYTTLSTLDSALLCNSEILLRILIL